MAQLTRERGLARLQSLRDMGQLSETASGRHLLKDQTHLLIEALSVVRLDPRFKTAPIRDLIRLPDELVAILTLQTMLDSLKDKHISKIARKLGGVLEDEERLTAAGEDDPLLFNKLVMVSDRKGDTGWQRKRRLYSAFGRESADSLPSAWNQEEKMKVGLYLVGLVLKHCDIFTSIKVSSGQRNRKSQLAVVLTPETHTWMQEADLKAIELHPYYLPCVAVPLDWSSPFGGGYHTNQVLQKPLVRTFDRNHLSELAQAEMATVYRAINCLQRTAWAINEDVYQLMKWAWEEDLQIGGLPARDEHKLPEKPEKYERGNPEHSAIYKERGRLQAINNKARASRVTVFKTLHMAELVRGEGRFFYPHFCDWRGRMYPLVAFLQPQGTDEARGLLKFADGEPIDTPEAEFWLAVAGANAFGVDKVPHEERREWVRSKERMIRAVADDPADCLWWAEADKPWSFLAWCLEWGAYLDHQETGDAAPFISHQPCPQDGSNNGLQLFSFLMRDQAGGEATCVVPTGQPEDIYQRVAEKVTVKLLEAQTKQDENSQEAFWAQRWLEFCGGAIDRKVCKRPVMTKPYGSTLFSCHKSVVEWLHEKLMEEALDNPFPQDELKPSMFLSRMIWQAVDETVSAAPECMTWLRDVSDVVCKLGLPIRWTSPSGLPVKQEYLKKGFRAVKSNVSGRTLQGSVSTAHKGPDPHRSRNGISPNLVHSLDAACAALTLEKLYNLGVRDFAWVHDSYAVHARHTATMNKALREVFAEVFSKPQLEEFKAEVESYLPAGETLPDVPEVGTMDVRQVLDSPYFFA